MPTRYATTSWVISLLCVIDSFTVAESLFDTIYLCAEIDETATDINWSRLEGVFNSYV